MRKHSKAIAAIVGSVVSILVAEKLLPPGFLDPELQAGLVAAITAAIVWLAPANATGESR